ncbi:MAG: efflux RND transporter periplasmic adaptor subunit [Caulobacter sp.]|nr:efflux RND transporter periplasmic adaptor subunit [Caulobacter sp.]
MQIKRSYLIAGLIVAAFMLFFIGGTVLRAIAPKAKPAESTAKTEAPLVKVALVQEVQRPYLVSVRGRTDANKTVVVRAETAGPVRATPAREGGFVAKGALLCQLSVDARQASLDQARAALRSRQLQREASERLAAQGYRSQTQVLSDQANLDAASAAVRQAEVLLEQVNIRAPFAGVFDHRDAEVGAYLAPGAACGTMIQLDPMVVIADVSEAEVGALSIGAPARATLVSGEVLSGRVRSVSRDADPATRTYRVEIEARNPGLRVRSGLSADVKVTVGSGPALLVPAATLVLDSAGRQGVRYIRADGLVGFAPVQVQDETPEGIWITGLRGPVQVIIVGQSYVSEGQKVRTDAR